MTDPQSFVIVTPVYEDTEAASILFKALATEFRKDVYVIAIDDGSVWRPLNIETMTNAGLSGCVIKLKRNLGHQRAIAVGLNYATQHRPESKVVVMDSDGEDVPSTIHSLLKGLENQNVDAVVAERKSRIESVRFRIFYWIYKKLFHCLSGRKISFGNYMALSPAAVRRLTAMHELWVHIAACVLSSKLRIIGCPLDRGARYAGKSKMNFTGLALHGFRGLMVFAEDVLVRVGTACTGVALLSIIAAPIPLILKAVDMATPGWASIIFGISMLLFIQAGTLALLSLLLTGLSRFAITTPDYKQYIDEIVCTT